MQYSNVYVDAIKYALGPIVVSSEELENRLKPIYEKLHLRIGQLQGLTGILERRWWEKNTSLADKALEAAEEALSESEVNVSDIGALIYAGVCRENFEPATACKVAAGLGLSEDAFVYDVSNACLGVLNAILDVANRIELGQIRAGLVVSCETSREINEIVIEQMLEEKNMELFTKSLATLTGGSGAVAVLITNGELSRDKRRKLLAGVVKSAPAHHGLCLWGLKELPNKIGFNQFTVTDAASVLKFGVELGRKTWKAFLGKLNWTVEQVDKVICHQVGAAHHKAILTAIGMTENKDYTTYPYLGNIGTVSLPLTAALAEENDFLKPGDRVGFLGIGSGLNCMMLGFQW